MKSEYRKFTDRIALDAAEAATAAHSAELFSWLTGDWLWQGRPVHFAPAPYGISLQPSNEPFLIFNAATGFWLLVLSDPDAYGVLVGLDPRFGRARFTGNVTISGEEVELHQTWLQLDDGSIEIRNERRSGNHWQLWDRSCLRRVKL